MVNTFYVLGAGTSKYAGAPLMGNFMKEAYKNGKINNRLLDFIRRFYKRRLSKQNLPNVEELLSIIDLCLSRKDELVYKKSRKIKQFDTDTLEALKFDTDYLIASTLYEKLKGMPQIDYMSRFINKLIPNVNEINVGFISMNYDILLDNALLNHLGVRRRNDEETKIIPLDYGCKLRMCKTESYFTAVEVNKTNVKLFKPHGSLNLLTCSVCKSMFLTLYEKGMYNLFEKDIKCYWDKSCLKGFIVPPTLFKTFEDFHLQSIWQRIDEELSLCKKLVFIGYSLSDADVYFKYMIKRALMKNNNEVKIEVYTGNNNWEKDRYVSTFGKNIYFKDTTFEKYVDNFN